MKVLAGALAFLLAGAAIGAAVGLVFRPIAVQPPEPGLEFVNWIGPILGGGIGGTFGLIFGGGWLASRISRDGAERRR